MAIHKSWDIPQRKYSHALRSNASDPKGGKIAAAILSKQWVRTHPPQRGVTVGEAEELLLCQFSTFFMGGVTFCHDN